MTPDQVHGLIFVIDSANAARLDDVAKVFAEVAKEPMVAGKPILVYNNNMLKLILNTVININGDGCGFSVRFANKQDLPGALSEAEISARLGLSDIQHCRNSVVKCTALPAGGVKTDNATLDPAISRGIKWLTSSICTDWPGAVHGNNSVFSLR